MTEISEESVVDMIDANDGNNLDFFVNNILDEAFTVKLVKGLGLIIMR